MKSLTAFAVLVSVNNSYADVDMGSRRPQCVATLPTADRSRSTNSKLSYPVMKYSGRLLAIICDYNSAPSSSAAIEASIDTSTLSAMASQLHGTVLAPREGSLDAMKIVEPIFPFTETTETSTLESETAIPTATQTRTLPASSTPENTQDSGTEATLDTGPQPTQTVTDTQVVNTFGPHKHTTSPPSIQCLDLFRGRPTLSVSTTTYSMSSIGFTVNVTSPSTSLSPTISQHTKSQSASSSDSSIRSNGARSKNSHFPAGAIGGIVGGVVLLLFTLAFVVCILRKRARGSIVGLENAAHPSRPSLSAGQETLAAEPAVKLGTKIRNAQYRCDHARQLSLPQSSAPNDNRDPANPLGS
ncbi:hypothetical protein BC629DRAFT_1549300, partial [Irpex lacteus]